MTDWANRPTEVAYNLNPAYCGWLLREAAEGYSDEKPAGLPFTLAFLVLPLVLHPATRESLPKSTATTLHAWLQGRPEARLGFAARAAQLVPVTREAILMAGALGRLGFGDGGTLLAAGKLGKGKAAILERCASLKASVQKAKLVGKWFAGAGDPATVFHMWGVRP